MVPAALEEAFKVLDRRLDPVNAASVALALSGGSDSLALLHLAHAWARCTHRRLLALTVDHGLHADSVAWTQAAGAAAAGLGVSWRALAWTGRKPATGLPAAARRARHALLSEAARAAGARVLLVGHTADDVAESELIRGATPAHGRLAEWSPSPVWPEGRGVFVLRPLLSQRRADLQAWLSTQGLAWLDDPANADLRFARSRARASLAETRAMPTGVSRTRALEEVGNAGRSACWVDAYGGLDLDPCRLALSEHPLDVLARALVCVGGGARPPSGAALGRLWGRLASGEAFTATLSGTRVCAEGRRVRLTRELGRAPPAATSLAAHVAYVFDGRFEMKTGATGWRVTPLSGRAAALSRSDREALHLAPADARSSLPALLGPGGDVRLPSPFGSGPAHAHPLAGERLAASLGGLPCESALEATSRPRQARGAAGTLILS